MAPPTYNPYHDSREEHTKNKRVNEEDIWEKDWSSMFPVFEDPGS